MFDLWGFLLQTLSASGVAVLILAVKALFKDKLPPKWQFAVWGVLGILMLIPAGIGGSYLLFRWQLAVELIKSLFGDLSFTNVSFPLPVITAVPGTVAEWIFALYVLGVVVHLLKYAVSYFRLRHAVSMGSALTGEQLAQIQKTAAERGVKLSGAVAVHGLQGAFICGVLRPVLVLPAQEEIDEKILLHELFHLKNRDTGWSVLICALRSLHWCNPLIVYCSNRALNDLESRCDQYVLENLEGEARREYGRILLSMASERFSKTPGSTCIHNGGRNIRARIENIARFKKYPQGMELVSVCILILLLLPLAQGTQAAAIQRFPDSVSMTLASARSIACTTPAGAFDTYGKAVLERNGYYRAMCAPQNMQADLLEEMLQKDAQGIYPTWDPGIGEWANKQEGFYVYNLKRTDSNTYEGLLVIELNYPPDGKAEEPGRQYLAVQTLRVEKEAGRWVAVPLEDFRYVETASQSLQWGCHGLPGITYSAEASGIRLEVTYQTVHMIDLRVSAPQQPGLFSGSYSDTTPRPNAAFSSATRSQSTTCIYIGKEEAKASITHIGVSSAPVYPGKQPPVNLRIPSGDHISGNSNTGEHWCSQALGSGWPSTVFMDGGGSSIDPTKVAELPEYFVADLYLNHDLAAKLKLVLQEVET